MFGRVLVARGRLTTVLGRGIGVLAGVVVLSGLGSGYRALLPPTLRVELVGADRARLGIHLEHSGRGVVEVQVELVERSGTRRIGSHLVRGSRFPVFNPFSVGEDFQVELPRDRGPGAIVRVTAVPSTQWRWQPPSVVRELPLGGESAS